MGLGRRSGFTGLLLGAVAWAVLASPAARGEGSETFGAGTELLRATDLRVDVGQPGDEWLRWTGTGTAGIYDASGDFVAELASGATIALANRAAETLRVVLAEDQPGPWDLAVETSSGAVAGRVHATHWRLDSGGTGVADRTQGGLYARVSTDGGDAVYWVRFSGLSGGVFSVMANATGLSGAWAGRSGLEAAADVAPLYPLYLSKPSVQTAGPLPVPSATVSGVEGATIAACDSLAPGTTELVLRFTAPGSGTYRLVCDTDGTPGFDPTGADWTRVGTATAGANALSISGTDPVFGDLALGAYDCQLSLSTGELHVVFQDAETHYPGLQIFQLVDGATVAVAMRWSDDAVAAAVVNLPSGAPGALRSGADGMTSGDPSSEPVAGVDARAWGRFEPASRGNDAYLDTYVWSDSATTAPFRIEVADVLADADLDQVPDHIETCVLGTDPALVDSDGDGLADDVDSAFGQRIDTDGDGTIDALDPDSDGDGVRDGDDLCARGELNWVSGAASDQDGDGCRDATEDTDDDDDGIEDGDDVSPLDPARCEDRDGDGCDDCSGGAGPDVSADGLDTDGDGLCDEGDADDDGDGVLDGADEAPLDAERCQDLDQDGCDDCSVTGPNGAPDPTNDGRDEDGNGICDLGDIDEDADGIVTARERQLALDPLDADSDDDGVLDGDEWGYDEDSDGDGLINALDVDSDNDGVLDGTELGLVTTSSATDVSRGFFVADRDATTTTDPTRADSDGGGVSDGAEDPNHDGVVDDGETDPAEAADDVAPPDADEDGLSNAQEAFIGTNSNDPDSDDDGVIDGQEANFAVDTDGDGTVNAADPDADGDGLFDGLELGLVTTTSSATRVAAGFFVADADPTTTTHPLLSDSDRGGVLDGIEDINQDGRVDANETDPNVAADDPVGRDLDEDTISDAEEGPWDADGDGTPNFADADADDDGVDDADEAGDAELATPPVDTDGDGTPDYLDSDSDGDGLADGVDNCRLVRNPSQADADGDGAGDVCVDDMDGDGFRDGLDGCPGVADPGQEDSDGDGVGDACDADVDGDGFDDDLVLGRGQACGCRSAAGPAGPTSGLVALLFAAGLLLLRRRRPPAMWLLAVALALPLSAKGQSSQAFSPERFHMSLDREGILDVEWADVPDHGSFDLSLMGVFADDLVILERERAGGGFERAGALVKGRFSAEVGAAVSLGGWFQLAASLPTVLHQRADDAVLGVASVPTLSASGIGDLRILPKLRILKQRRQGISLALRSGFILPTASAGGYFGDDSLAFHPELLVSGAWSGVRIAVNAGYLVRAETTIQDAVVFDDALTARVGLGYRIGGGRGPVELDLSASGATPVDAAFETERLSPLEVHGGVQVFIARPWVLFAGAGTGISRAVQVPDWRSFVGLRYAPHHRDADDDGLEDGDDRCPDRPEDRDGFQDEDGCPDPDNDGDRVLDAQDGAPDEPEDIDGFEDADGVPDPDNDGDGVLDTADRCPEQAGPAKFDGCPDGDGDGVGDADDKCQGGAEDHDGFRDHDGCPDPDNDEDGVLDAADRCPTKAGPLENRGCPDTDRDKDGVVDRLDNCPDEPGDPKRQGCKKKQLVEIRAQKLRILEKVYFATGRARIRPRSFALLRNVASVLKAHPEIQKLRIEGHTDSRGAARRNLRLSEIRARAVRAFLIRAGIDGDRLEAVGKGESESVADNATREGRAQNRRVEFHIVDQPATTEAAPRTLTP